VSGGAACGRARCDAADEREVRKRMVLRSASSEMEYLGCTVCIGKKIVFRQ
jgi:hypothetical protein